MANITLAASELYPLKFSPIYQERIWGGNLMSECLKRQLPEHSDPIGESWELVDRPEANSIVSEGELAGVSLNELFKHYSSALAGRLSARFDRFPLLVKIIDAGSRLSLQVHPDENTCRELGNGAEPKTEMWYVIAAKGGAKILAGLQSRTTQFQIKSLLDSPEIESQLQVYNSLPGDAYYISAGTLHAIGAGNLILEIQQNSDTTYRISDWGRVDSNGKPRQLHLEEGMKSINFTNRTNPRIAGVVGSTGFNRKFDVVKICPHFQVSDLRICSAWMDNTAPGDSFHLLSSVYNQVEVGRGDRKAVINPGESVLMPANFGAYTIEPLSGSESVVVKTTL